MTKGYLKRYWLTIALSLLCLGVGIWTLLAYTQVQAALVLLLE